MAVGPPEAHCSLGASFPSGAQRGQPDSAWRSHGFGPTRPRSVADRPLLARNPRRTVPKTIRASHSEKCSSVSPFQVLHDARSSPEAKRPRAVGVKNVDVMS
jgi:hypothetical protein